jgi:hypothetical protein
VGETEVSCVAKINFFLLNLDTIGAVWRHNKSAWMTHHIMKEWLKWFDNRMKCQNKKVLLLMDNFSAHELGVEQMEEKRELTNTKVNISLYLETLAYSS